jgi:hypothetical protein
MTNDMTTDSGFEYGELSGNFTYEFHKTHQTMTNNKKSEVPPKDPVINTLASPPQNRRGKNSVPVPYLQPGTSSQSLTVRVNALFYPKTPV